MVWADAAEAAARRERGFMMMQYCCLMKDWRSSLVEAGTAPKQKGDHFVVKGGEDILVYNYLSWDINNGPLP